MTRAKQILAFLCASFLLSGLIYRDAMWGESLLAPLDLGPKLFKHYQFMDPAADGVPANHHIVDQFTYDLPLQAAIHAAYKAGEIPWWDPYTYGGRPLLADAHVNGTDPIRLLCYRLLPFELAYNWNYILRGLVTGLGMFLLLSSFGLRALAASILAIAYQFAGWYTLFFGHPWIQGSFAYFPFIWLLWSRASRGAFARNTALAALACGLVFYAGNLQSHTYLPLFAMAFVLAHAFNESRAQLLRATAVCALSGGIGALLAFPVLANQVEFYLNSLRPVGSDEAWYARFASLPFSLASFYPWSTGTFRTLEVTKAINGAGATFPLFFGAIGSFLALLGCVLCRSAEPARRTARLTGLLLLIGYLGIVATPLSAIFYTRSAGLAGMGLTVLAGLALQELLDGRLALSKAWLRGFALLMGLVALASSCLAWFAYPRFIPLIERKLAAAEASTSYASIPTIAAMRNHQIRAFPDEVSLRNPEAALTLLAVLLFSGVLMKAADSGARLSRERLVLLALAVGTIPVLMFHARFRPKHPIELWQRMLVGGDAQKEALAMARGGLRLDESDQVLANMIFPNAMGCLYRIHCVQGYSALQPPGVFRYPLDAPPLFPGWRADLGISNSKVVLTTSSGNSVPNSRFRRADNGQPATIAILDESFNSLTLDLAKQDPHEPLIRTDSYYPGWSSMPAVPIEKRDPCFFRIGPLPPGAPAKLELRYSPSLSRFFGPAIGTGAASIALLAMLPLLSQRKPRMKRSNQEESAAG